MALHSYVLLMEEIRRGTSWDRTFQKITLPETTIAPEKWWLEDYFQDACFQALCYF